MNEFIEDNRRYIRRSAKSRVTVVNRGSSEHLGTLVDVSEEGFGIAGFTPCDAGTSYALALLHLPTEIGAPRVVDFEAECKWCRKISTSSFASGFALSEIPSAVRKVFDSL